jgi:hypothetical protein
MGDSTCREKEDAGNNLGDYSAFYNSGSIPFVLNNPISRPKMSRYYANIFKILYPLIINNVFIPWATIFHGCGNAEQKAARYMTEILAEPIIVAELIPFHSKETPTINIPNLYASDPNYQIYHNELFNMLNLRLANNGILFSNGQSASKALKDVLAHRGLVINRAIPGCDFGTWNNRLVVLLNEQLGRRNGRFNSNIQYEALINEISIELGTLGIAFP